MGPPASRQAIPPPSTPVTRIGRRASGTKAAREGAVVSSMLRGQAQSESPAAAKHGEADQSGPQQCKGHRLRDGIDTHKAEDQIVEVEITALAGKQILHTDK